ncbi:unnamed protein product, partial [Rotaria sp. Silwood1]
KSFDDQNIQKSYSNNSTTIDTTRKLKQPKNKSSSSLSFSKVFITSVSQIQTKDDEIQKPLTTTTTSSLSDNSPSNNIIIIPKPILKKSSPQTSPNRISGNYHEQKKISSIYTNISCLLHNNIPKPIPRSSLKQLKQDESLV